MTVGELIEKLKDMPQDAEVVTDLEDTEYYFSSSPDVEFIGLDADNNEVVLSIR